MKAPTRLLLLALLALIASPVAAQDATEAETDSVVADQGHLSDMLSENLGVSPEQAMGGAAALFGYAKGKLTKEEFSQVAEAVPDMDAILEATPSAEEPAGVGQGAISATAGSVSELGNLSSLASPFSKLGMQPEMVAQFVPLMLSYVEAKGGEPVRSLLETALK